jgi:hypothetical protein
LEEGLILVQVVFKRFDEYGQEDFKKDNGNNNKS